MKNGKDKSKVIKAILVFCVMEDDAVVPVDFAPGHAPMVAGYLRHIHGGKIRLREEKVLIINDTEAIRRAIDEIEHGTQHQTRRQRFVRFWKRISTSPEAQPSVRSQTRRGELAP